MTDLNRTPISHHVPTQVTAEEDHDDLRERITATLATHNLPDLPDRDGQWAADALMPVIAGHLADRWEEGRKHGLRQAWRPHDARTTKGALRMLAASSLPDEVRDATADLINRLSAQQAESHPNQKETS